MWRELLNLSLVSVSEKWDPRWMLFKTVGVLMTLSGNSTESLWPLSMMCLAGWNSVTVEFNSNCLRFWRKVHIFIRTLMLLNQCKAMRRRHNQRDVFSAPIAHGRRLQEELSGSAYTINMGKNKSIDHLVWSAMKFFIPWIMLLILLYAHWVLEVQRQWKEHRMLRAAVG